MLKEVINKIINEIWPTTLICLVILVALRLTYLIKNKQKIVLYKELLSLWFIIYIICLFYVVTYQDVSYSTSNFIPFKEMFRYHLGSRLFIKNVLGNMLLFVPFGFFAAYYLQTKSVSLVFILSLLVSLTIEITQLMIGRVFDIDDIILNVVGGIIGIYIYTICTTIFDKTSALLKKETIYNIILVIGIIGMILYLV